MAKDEIQRNAMRRVMDKLRQLKNSGKEVDNIKAAEYERIAKEMRNKLGMETFEEEAKQPEMRDAKYSFIDQLKMYQGKVVKDPGSGETTEPTLPPNFDVFKAVDDDDENFDFELDMDDEFDAEEEEEAPKAVSDDAPKYERNPSKWANMIVDEYYTPTQINHFAMPNDQPTPQRGSVAYWDGGQWVDDYGRRVGVLPQLNKPEEKPIPPTEEEVLINAYELASALAVRELEKQIPSFSIETHTAQYQKLLDESLEFINTFKRNNNA